MDIYKEIILDNYKNPKNFGSFEEKDANTLTLENPSCGDTITLSVQVKNGRLKDIRFLGKGCALSISGASLLTEYAKGKSLEEIALWNKDTMTELLGVDVGLARIKCALLPLETLHKVLQKMV